MWQGGGLSPGGTYTSYWVLKFALGPDCSGDRKKLGLGNPLSRNALAPAHLQALRKRPANSHLASK